MEIIFESNYNKKKNWDKVEQGIFDKYFPEELSLSDIEGIRKDFDLLKSSLESDFLIVLENGKCYEAWKLGGGDPFLLMEGFDDSQNRKRASEIITDFIDNFESFKIVSDGHNKECVMIDNYFYAKA